MPVGRGLQSISSSGRWESEWPWWLAGNGGEPMCSSYRLRAPSGPAYDALDPGPSCVETLRTQSFPCAGRLAGVQGAPAFPELRPRLDHGARPRQDAVVQQRWETITFLHWDYPIDVVQRLLPPTFEVEPWDGRAWVGLLPFFMRVRPLIGPPLRALTTFPESNVRTYVRGPDGRPGILFFSLDAASTPAVTAGRCAYGLPYHLATMRIRRQQGHLQYTSRRLGVGAPGHDIVVVPEEPLTGTNVTQFDRFLTARFLLWTTRRGKVMSVRADHPPWALRRARVERLNQSLLGRVGLPEPTDTPVVHYSQGVDVHLGRPELVGL